MAMYLMINNTRGISSYQLARQIGVTQKTAWFMGHRIRKTFKQDEEKLSGMVAMDEAFVGGRNANRHIHKKVKNNNDRTFVDKVTVIGMLSAQKGLKCYMIKTTRNHHLQSAVRLNVESGSHIITDEWKGYQGFYEGEYTHSTVNHSARKFYSEDGLSTNGVENVWSNLKKMMMGTYNWVSRRHFQKYMDEFTFRYNNRKNKESINFGSLLKKVNHSYPYKLLKYGEDQERTYTYQDGRESEYRGSTPAYLHASEKEGEEGKERVRKNIQLLKILAPHLLERHKKHLPKKD
jgi:transposase-like protein